jgi:dihydropteroate synthase
MHTSGAQSQSRGRIACFTILVMRPVFTWNLGNRTLELGKRTLVMGILNVTPDSFSDGGRFFDRGKAVEQGVRLLSEGADIVDVGGESTRPGTRVLATEDTPASKSRGTSSSCSTSSASKAPVSEADELERVIPVVTELKKQNPKAVISVDTYKASVARAAVNAGAEIVNDVSGFRWDRSMIKTLAELKCGAIMMHMRGRPEEWRSLPAVADMVLLIKRELSDWTQAAVRQGVKRDTLVLDPGLGFGKNFEQNYPLLKRLDELHTLRFPLLVGVSRKSFVGRALANDGKDAPVTDRLYGTLAAETAAVIRGAHIIRTHDVKASVDAVHMADNIA